MRTYFILESQFYVQIAEQGVSRFKRNKVDEMFC